MSPSRFPSWFPARFASTLEERFNFRAPERTTDEFLCELQSSFLLTRDQKRSLGDFLASCDLIKFAKYEPTEMELRGLYQSALRLVNETEPRPIPAHVPPPLPSLRPGGPPAPLPPSALSSAPSSAGLANEGALAKEQLP